MAKSRDSVLVTGSSLEEILSNLNFILQRFNDRLDALEGLRGNFATESDSSVTGNLTVTGDTRVHDDDGNLIHSMQR